MSSLSDRPHVAPQEARDGLFQSIAAAAQGDPLERCMAHLTRYVSTLVPAAAHAFTALHAAGPPMRPRAVVVHLRGGVATWDSAAVDERYREVEHADPFHPARWDESRAVLIGTAELGDAGASPYARRFLEPLGFGPQLVLYLRDRLRIVGFITLLRTRDEVDFDGRDRRALLLCHPVAQYSLALARRVAHGGEQTGRGVSSVALTDRERDVLGLLASGATNDAIARSLSLSPETVKTHLSRLYRKFGVHNRTELVIRVLDEL